MDQAIEQSNTVDSAAKAMEQSGIIDSILGEDQGQPAEEIQEPESEQEEDQAEDQDDSQEESDEPIDEPTDEEPEQVEIKSIDQLAENLGASKDDILDNLTLDVVIDGETRTVSLREAQKGYQLDADYRRKTAEVANQRREQEHKWQQEAQKVEQQHQLASQVLLHAERELYGELNSVNFAELQKTDPVEWATRYAQLQQRQQQIQSVKQQAQQAYIEHNREIQERQQKALQQRLQEEVQSLQTLIPNFKEVKPDLDDYLAKSYGFTNDELTTVIDHRLVDLARKAMLYDRLQGGKQQAVKAVKAKPKLTQKPGKSAPKDTRGQRYKQAKAKARKTGHIRDAAAAIENLL